MAYNVLKGSVEGSVDQYGDQEIEGIKVFKSTISASVFYDTDAKSPCATLKDVAVTEIKGKIPGAVLTYDGVGILRTCRNLKYDGATLTARNIFARSITGSACGLREIPVNKFDGVIEGKYIQHGLGIHSVRGKLQVKIADGLHLDKDGIGISLDSKSGLALKSNKLMVDPTKSSNINRAGQNVSDEDVLLIADATNGVLYNTTLLNLYNNYIDTKMPQAAGAKNAIQLKGRKGFAASSKLSYDTVKDILMVEGRAIAHEMEVEGDLVCRGAVVQNINCVTQEHYEVAPDDYTILCDSIKKPITVMLPPACNHRGRILIIKKANSDPYNLRSYPVAIKAAEDRVDVHKEILIKVNSSARTLQSDGSRWWVIATKGT